MSDRTRLDLILNDFVWNYINTGSVVVLSDGKPLRPLIDVEDMSRAMTWAATDSTLKNFDVFNCGYNEANYSVSEIAYKVTMGNINAVSINKNAPPDKRSYRVDFSKFKNASGFSVPIKSLEVSISELKTHLSTLSKIIDHTTEIKKCYKRHETLKKLIENKFLNKQLSWIK